MDNKIEKYYLDRFEMFTSQGWKDLMEDVENMMIATNDINKYNDEKSFHKAKGELSIMKWLIDLEQVSNLAYKTLQEEE